MAKSHEYIVQVIQTLNANIDNKELDKLAIFEEAMNKYNWPKQKKAIESKYNLLIKNGTRKIVNTSTQANVILGRLIFKLKKD